MTIQESVAHYLALQQEFEPWLRETETQFSQPRQPAMIQLQARLQQANAVHRTTLIVKR